MDTKLDALIVDDEESARKLLLKLLEETLCFRYIRLAHSVDSATKELELFDPDLIFLDIKMPGKDGFSIVQDLQYKGKKPGIVFVTAYDQFAIQAIKSHAFDYLLKPVDRTELKKCVLSFLDRKRGEPIMEGSSNSEIVGEKINRIRVNTRKGTFLINPSTILYCKAEGNYSSICTGVRQHLCSMNLGKLADLLPGNGFIRLGRSYIVNYEYITMIDRKKSQVTLIRENESVTIQVSRQHIKDLDII
jgi:two-component system LytT family response regulator